MFLEGKLGDNIINRISIINSIGENKDIGVRLCLCHMSTFSKSLSPLGLGFLIGKVATTVL